MRAIFSLRALALCAALVAFGLSTTGVHATYTTISASCGPEGCTAQLALQAPGPYGKDVPQLDLNVYFETNDRLRFRLTPSVATNDVTSFELPNDLLATQSPVNGATDVRSQSANELLFTLSLSFL